MKKIILVIAGIILVGGVCFYGGMKYGRKSLAGGRGAGNFTNLTDEQRQARMQQFGAGVGTGFSGNKTNGGGMVVGEIISKDENGITVKLKDGGSKTVLISGSATITKNAAGVAGDLKVGTQVMVSGTANTDGSVSAKSVQIMPAQATD
ncbi:MAG: hypothetical protein PHP03_02265 [Candidatus Pacebacteria bacterium]|nr:hypothetical protein [Candidatus Paceibacterota bacterium]